MSDTNRYLLILACSERKRTDSGFLPALERYDGVNYRVVQKIKREGYLIPNLDILILSAKYGLISADTPIENYDFRMTRSRAVEIQAEVGAKLDFTLRTTYTEVFINLGKTYMSALATSKLLVSDDTNIICSIGGIGKKMSQMKTWLHTLIQSNEERR
jgi:cytoplasmic iron level regulating protein YaaA (DUF328/UPF0246 family)